MKGSRRSGGRELASGYLDSRDEAGRDRAMHGDELPFARDPEAAEATATAIMSRIRADGAPEAGPARLDALAAARPSRSRGFRLAGLAAAAVFVAALSSIVTLGLIRSGTTVNVRFVLVAPEARSVWLAADFNGWSPDGYELERSAGGAWEITVPLRKGSAYAYNFVIDGQRWIPDPSSPVRLDDGFGGETSSLSL